MPVADSRKSWYNPFSNREVADKLNGQYQGGFKIMKIAYRASKNKNGKLVHVEPEIEPTTQTTHNEVSFILVAKGILGFRESAHLIKIAEETNCTMTIASGKKLGTTKSIL